jgi:tartrate dehydrogenase/decarboxylase/D-malate dehydrogenase
MRHREWFGVSPREVLTMEYRIALIPGDGIGKEVIPEGVRVLESLATAYGFTIKFNTFPYSCGHYIRHGEMMPADGLERLKVFDAILLGAVDDPKVPDLVSLWVLLLPIRRSFDQYVNLRPVRLLPGIESPLAGRRREDVDFS